MESVLLPKHCYRWLVAESRWLKSPDSSDRGSPVCTPVRCTQSWSALTAQKPISFHQLNVSRGWCLERESRENAQDKNSRQLLGNPCHGVSLPQAAGTPDICWGPTSPAWLANFCHWMQVWLPATTKAKLVRQVLGRSKEVYSSAGHLRRWWALMPKPILTSRFRQRFL